MRWKICHYILIRNIFVVSIRNINTNIHRTKNCIDMRVKISPSIIRVSPGQRRTRGTDRIRQISVIFLQQDSCTISWSRFPASSWFFRDLDFIFTYDYRFRPGSRRQVQQLLRSIGYYTDLTVSGQIPDDRSNNFYDRQDITHIPSFPASATRIGKSNRYKDGYLYMIHNISAVPIMNLFSRRSWFE